jgi:hypothetical protein
VDYYERRLNWLIIHSILGQNATSKTPDTDPQLVNLHPSFDARIRAKAREVLVTDELGKRMWVAFIACLHPANMCRKQKVAFANEGAEQARKDEEIATRKRKAEESVKWEGEHSVQTLIFCRATLTCRVVQMPISRSIPADETHLDNLLLMRTACPCCSQSARSILLSDPYLTARA